MADLSYTEASRELDEIVAFFEQREVDVDQLVARLERATAIVDELDRRLRRTRAQVEELVPRLARPLASTDRGRARGPGSADRPGSDEPVARRHASKKRFEEEPMIASWPSELRWRIRRRRPRAQPDRAAGLF